MVIRLNVGENNIVCCGDYSETFLMATLLKLKEKKLLANIAYEHAIVKKIIIENVEDGGNPSRSRHCDH